LSNRWEGRRAYIRQYSGRKVHLAEPTPEQFHLPDIAHHLARIRRYTGGSEFSVAQHMVVGAAMARWYYPHVPLLDKRFLIHDVSEYALGDVSSPLKSLLPGYRELESRWNLAVEQWADLTFVGIPEVEELDVRMWLTERLTVYAHVDPAVLAEDTSNVKLDPLPVSEFELEAFFKPWDTEQAEAEYLRLFRAAFPGVK
jgi:hypothetical protein